MCIRDRYFPAEIEKTQGFIKGFQSDIRTVAAHPLPEEGFCGMEVNGTQFTEKAEAGEAILAVCKANQSLEPVPLGLSLIHISRIEKWDEVYGNQASDERMMAFLDSATDQYAILQLRRSEDTVYERFSSMHELERMGLEPNIDHYEVVYTAPLLPYKDQNTMLRCV